MTVLITGASKSGKSAVAEELAVALGRSDGKRLYYVATMENNCESAHRRINAHRLARQGKSFITIECSRSVGQLVLPDSTVLLECLTVLIANELFLPDGTMKDPVQTADYVFADLMRLAGSCRNLITVCSDVFCGGTAYSETVAAYLDVLSSVRNRFAAFSTAVIEVTAGIPVYIKGAVIHDCV